MRTLTNWLSAALCIMLGMLCSCTHNDITPHQDTATLSFQVTNYIQYAMDEGTRATSASNSKILKHLALAVYDAATDKPATAAQVQDNGSDGYGTFQVTLPYGQYRIVVLGYSGDKACDLSNPKAISFADGYVPHTFLHSEVITVDKDTQHESSITLKRVVAGFQILMDDAIPQNASSFRITTTGGSTTLDATTGLAPKSTGRTSSLNLTDDLKGKTGKKLNTYLFLASETEDMDIEVTAVDAKDATIKQRTFTSVPMKVNTLTVYKGQFFAADAFSFGISVDEEWGETIQKDF